MLHQLNSRLLKFEYLGSRAHDQTEISLQGYARCFKKLFGIYKKARFASKQYKFYRTKCPTILRRMSLLSVNFWYKHIHSVKSINAICVLSTTSGRYLTHILRDTFFWKHLLSDLFLYFSTK
jgi:hypothetical protein